MRKTATKLAAVLAAAVFMSTAAVNAQAKDDSTPGGTAQYQKRDPRIPLTPEQREKLDAMVKESQEKLQPLQEQMMAKNLELQAVSRNPNTDRATVTKLSQEIAALHTRMMKEHEALRERMSKELSLPLHPGFPPHRGGPGRGYGNFPGYGMMGHHMFPMMGCPMMMESYGIGPMGPYPADWTQLPPKNAAQPK